jgi:hypothetical protein
MAAEFRSQPAALLAGLLIFAAGPAGPAFADRQPQPEQGDWAVSAGGFFMHLDIDFTADATERAIGGGGFLAAEHYFLPGLAVELALHATPDLDTSVRTRDILVTGDELRGTLDIQAVFTTLGVKLYPLRLAPLRAWRVQPWLGGGIGMLVVPLSLSGTYLSPPDAPNRLRVEVTETVGLWHTGAGLDVRITDHLVLFVDYLHMTTFAEPKVSVTLNNAGLSTSARLRVETNTARVGLKWIF